MKFQKAVWSFFPTLLQFIQLNKSWYLQGWEFGVGVCRRGRRFEDEEGWEDWGGGFEEGVGGMSCRNCGVGTSL